MSSRKHKRARPPSDPAIAARRAALCETSRARIAELVDLRRPDRPRPASPERLAMAEGEIALIDRLAHYRPDRLEPGGALPYGPARGNLVPALFDVVDYDPGRERWKVAQVEARARRGPSALSRLAPSLRAAAGRYADLVARVASPGGPGGEGPRACGVSDGGATTRVRFAAWLRRAEAAIGADRLCLTGRRPGRPLPVRELVDRVCLNGEVIAEILGRAGWSARTERNRAAAAGALEAALERLAEVV